MPRNPGCVVVFAIIMAIAGLDVAAADEQPIDLKPGAGREAVEGNCGACHSLDYIPMNSPFLNAGAWNAEVTKMIKAFGAPISETDAKAIADYLAKNYGS
jgi:sulfite dehydrogenase (cytochrome) subunit B